MTRSGLQIMACFLMAIIVACCWCLLLPTLDYNPFRVIEPSDLVGTWRAVYDVHEYDRACWFLVTGVETLTLRADGTYQQVYNDGQGYTYTSPWNKWHFNGRTLHLEGGRFYPLGIEDAEKLANGQLYYYSDDDGTGRPLELDSTTGVILHAWPSHGGEIILQYPPVCDLDAPLYVEFHLVASPALTSTVSP